jgi:putative peptidoglycan lipid II flippase
MSTVANPPVPAVDASSSRRLARSASLTGAATLTSRVLGLARDQMLAAVFGAGNQMDAFIVAFRIPNLFRDLFAEGAMSSAFVPTFARELEQRGKESAWKLGNNLVNALIALTGVMVVIGILLSRPALGVYAGQFSAVPGKIDLTVLLTRVMLPFMTLAALSAALMGMLNSLHYYFVPALAPAMFNIATIVCAIVLVPFMPFFGLPRIAAIGIAALIGGAGQIALQWPSLRREGYRYQWGLNVRDPGLVRMLLLVGPGMVGLAATQINVLVNTLLATSLGTGAVSWLQYAFRLMYLPIGLFGVSIATATLPTVSRNAVARDRTAIRQTVVNAMNLTLILNVPAAVGLFVLATSIVRLLFERGEFLPVDTINTATALQCYAIGLVGYSAGRIVSPLFFALGHSRVPVELTALTVLVNIVISMVLVPVFGFAALAIGASVAALVNGAISLIFLRELLGGIEGRRLLSTFVRISVASLAMAVVIALVGRAMSAVFPESAFWFQAARLTLAVSSGFLALAWTARLLGISEFDEALAEVRSRIRNALAG